MTSTLPSLISVPSTILPSATGTAATTRGGSIVAIDGGATKTIAALMTSDGAFRTGSAGPSNADSVGLDGAQKALRESIAALGHEPGDIAAVVLGVAGLLEESEQQALCDAVAGATGVDSEHVLVVNDTVNAWAAGTAGQPGIVAIMGTGSNVLGVGPTGLTWRSGGWGHILGDEGSAWWLSLEGVRASVAFRDGRAEAPGFLDALLEHFAVKDVETLARQVYDRTKSEVAAAAKLIVAAADAGDAVALEMIDRGTGVVADQVAAVAQHIDVGDEAVLVSAVGGLATSAPLVMGAFTRNVLARLAQASVKPAEVSPLAGSLLLAGRLAGWDEAPLWRDLVTHLGTKPA